MSYKKILLGLAFLGVSVSTSPAQWGTLPLAVNRDHTASCRDVEITVKDQSDIAIMGAAVITENSYVAITTNSQGIAEVHLPCGQLSGMMVQISAPGYETSRMTMVPETGILSEVRLRKKQYQANAPELTISSHELSPSAQTKSRDLQNAAAQAFTRKDYDRAETLLMAALDVTPSAVSILSTLGVVEFYRKDLNAAGSCFEKAMQAAPYRPEFAGKLGVVRWMQHLGDESYDLLARAAHMGYETSLGNYIMGLVTLGKGLHTEAAAHLKKVPETQFRYRDLYLSLALRNCGKSRAADEAFHNFFKRNPAAFSVNILSKVNE